MEEALPEGMALTPVSLGMITPLRDDVGAGNPPSAARADAAPVRDAGAFDWVRPQASVSTSAAMADPNNSDFPDSIERSYWSNIVSMPLILLWAYAIARARPAS